MKFFKKKENEKNYIDKFDVVIVGGGQTGIVLAKHLIKKEVKTLVIDKQDLGIKTSLDIKNFVKLSKRFISRNENPANVISSFPTRLKYIADEQNKEFTSSLLNNSYFKFIKGDISEINEYEISVNNQWYKFRKLVFATGSYYDEPKNIPNFKREMYLMPNEIRNIETFYKTVAIYGSGIEALEIAYGFVLLGSIVYIFDENVNPFNNFDDEIESIIKTEFFSSRINWCLESKITNHIQASDTTTRIVYQSQGREKYVDVDKIIITENKKSETRNIKTKYALELNQSGSIIIDNTFKVKGNPTYYAIGDVNGIKMIPSYANQQAITLSKTLTGQLSKFDVYNSSFVIDIEPQIAFYGMNKQDLDFNNIKFHEFIYDFNSELNSKLYEHKAKLKVFTNEKHEILGVFIYGHKIKELLSIFILAANNKVKFHKLASLGLPFYTKSEFIRDAAIEYELEFVGLTKKMKKKSQKSNSN